jgi:hypothetical protein
VIESTFPGTYRDGHGSESLIFRNDGTILSTFIRGVEFSGSDFDSLGPADATPEDQLASFSLCHFDLCSCIFTAEMTVPVVVSGSTIPGRLLVELDLGAPAAHGGIEHEHLRLTLAAGGFCASSAGTSGSFECELLDLQRQLSKDSYIQACINCLYSDYSPYGQGLFGDMLCFRNIKSEYLNVTSKKEFWAVHGREERQVQETYLCDEFKRRVPGTGYRG